MSDIFVDNIKHQSSQGSGTITVGASGETVAPASGVMTKLGVFENQLLHVRDEKANDTDGGTFTSGDWRTRDLNTIKTNEITNASLSSNQITLPSGTYYIDAFAPVYNVQRHQTALYNITDSAFQIIGTSEYIVGSVNKSFVKGRFTISAQKTFELQHRCTNTESGDGLGVKTNFSQVCVYSEAQIWRIA